MTRGRVGFVLVAAFAFGLFAAWAKGPDTDAIGIGRRCELSQVGS